VFQLVQMVVLNYMALHGTQGNFPTLYNTGPGGTNPNNTLAVPLDSLISFQALAGLVNGKVPNS
jgi:hypothetical protein